jgi:hypothetical protein
VELELSYLRNTLVKNCGAYLKIFKLKNAYPQPTATNFIFSPTSP